MEKGDLVLANAGAHRKLNIPIRGFLCSAQRQLCERNPMSGQVIRASLDLDSQSSGSTMVEEVEAMLLIQGPDGGLIPVTWRVRRGACRGLVNCMDELMAATTPAWAELSNAHRLAAKLPYPWTRFVVEIDHRLVQPKGLGSNPYPVTSAICRPIDADMHEELKRFLAEENNMQLLDAVVKAHDKKLLEVNAKLAE